MSAERRAVPDRDAVALGVRVQLSWIQHAPYTRRADLTVDDRLARIVARDAAGWWVEDTRGERHHLLDDPLEEACVDAAAGRWRIEGAVPAYAVGERLRLHWRHRSPNRRVDAPRPDTWGTVIAEAPSTVTVRVELDGAEILMHRWGSQADETDRQAPRWFVIGPGAEDERVS